MVKHHFLTGNSEISAGSDPDKVSVPFARHLAGYGMLPSEAMQRRFGRRVSRRRIEP